MTKHIHGWYFNAWLVRDSDQMRKKITRKKCVLDFPPKRNVRKTRGWQANSLAPECTNIETVLESSWSFRDGCFVNPRTSTNRANSMVENHWETLLRPWHYWPLGANGRPHIWWAVCMTLPSNQDTSRIWGFFFEGREGVQSRTDAVLLKHHHHQQTSLASRNALETYIHSEWTMIPIQMIPKRCKCLLVGCKQRRPRRFVCTANSPHSLVLHSFTHTHTRP